MDNQLGGNPAGSIEQPLIPNHLVLAIISTVCCGCLPLGIVAIVFSTQVNGFLAAGNIPAAAAASKKAKMFAIISLVSGILINGIVALLYGSVIIMNINNR